MIALALDTDWCSQEALDYSLSLLRRSKATVFATLQADQTPYVVGNGNEIATHPTPETLDDLKKAYPGSVGVKTHGLYQSTDMLRDFAEDFKWEANTLMYAQHGLAPWKRPSGLVSVATCWEDDVSLDYGLSPYDLMPLSDYDGFAVVCFHPIHILMNTRSPEDYSDFALDTPALTTPATHRDFGVRDVFLEFMRIETTVTISTGLFGTSRL